VSSTEVNGMFRKKTPEERAARGAEIVARHNAQMAKFDRTIENATMRRYLLTTHPNKPTHVVKVRGQKDAETLISAMYDRGYTLENMASRKQAFSMLTGVFTSNQIHTLVFRKAG